MKPSTIVTIATATLTGIGAALLLGAAETRKPWPKPTPPPPPLQRVGPCPDAARRAANDHLPGLRAGAVGRFPRFTERDKMSFARSTYLGEALKA